MFCVSTPPIIPAQRAFSRYRHPGFIHGSRLSHLPDREVNEYFSRSALESHWGDEHSENEVRRRIARTRRDGYATNPALLVEGSWGLGAAVFDRAGRPAWALSVTGVQTRFGRDRRAMMGELLLDQAQTLSVRLQNRD